MQDVIQKCLEDQDPAVKLHGCKVRGDFHFRFWKHGKVHSFKSRSVQA